jgi:predicted ABC-type ATPase
MTAADPPTIVVIAGPNGAGKSTTAPRLLKGPLAVSEFVNADTIAQGLSAFRPETVAIAAGRAMLARMRALAAAKRSFAYETTLSSRTFAPWLRKLQREGYSVHILFLALRSADLAVARVAERVRKGGHDVPEAVIRRRFVLGLENLINLFQPFVDSWQVLDNADLGGPRVIARGNKGQVTQVHDPETWQNLLKALA